MGQKGEKSEWSTPLERGALQIRVRLSRGRRNEGAGLELERTPSRVLGEFVRHSLGAIESFKCNVCTFEREVNVTVAISYSSGEALAGKCHLRL